ncbi:RICIN domain-containing protein [Streptomyces sp. WMMC500]|uniref:RICIN domain-containing protein n=1 Tax=Streptomyces sp. WMMC500 TaxID=3015154 RepID=UPI00248AA804|nr:RICIN domain-containing protein [Streptomyces sp. WMMC500]WBB58504.1 RICIN domain-containing protein [Streptomyces sp. WMMC500]
MSVSEEPGGPGEPVGPGKAVSGGEPSEASRPIAVIISGDGSAEIDGVPVPVVGEEPVDVAILDTLHGYAHARDSAVIATISDPAAGYVAVVEVAPDGSSRLLEQHGQGADEDGASGPGGYSAPAGLDAEVPDFPDVGYVGDEKGLPSQSVPPALAPPPDPGPGPDEDSGRGFGRGSGRGFGRGSGGGFGGGFGRRGQQSQSDDEYRAPGLLKRPVFVGAAGVAVAAVILIPLIALGSSGGGEELNQSAATQEPDGRPTTQLNPGVPDPTFPGTSSPSSSPSPSDSPSGSKKPKPEETKKPKPKGTKDSPETAGPEKTEEPEETAEPRSKPPAGPSTGADPRVPKDEIVIRNKKYGLCLDLPGTGKSTPETRTRDAGCKPSGDDNQRWVLDLVDKGAGTRGADLYVVRNAESGLCLDLPGRGPGQVGWSIQVYDCLDSAKDNQRWWLHRRPNGTYWIRNQKSGDMCLDVARKSKKDPHAKVTLYGCSDLDDHQWNFLTN